MRRVCDVPARLTVALLLRPEWDGEPEIGAARRARRRPEAPAMGFDNRPADREPHSKAVGFRREEGFEHMLRDRRVQPRAGVLDRDEHAARLGEHRGYRQFPGAVRYPSHRFDAVHNEVQQHLLQLNAIADDRPIARRPDRCAARRRAAATRRG